MSQPSETSTASQYGKYTASGTQLQDADGLAAVMGDAVPPGGELLSQFITELRFFSPPADLAGAHGPKHMPLSGGPGPNYQLEHINPLHKFAGDLGPQEAAQLQHARDAVLDFIAACAVTGEKISAGNFTAWLHQRNPQEVGDVLALVAQWQKLKPEDLKKQQNLVNYLDMAARQAYVVEPGLDGCLYAREPDPTHKQRWATKPLDTQGAFAAFGASSRVGGQQGASARAIWVQGPSGRFYTSNHAKRGEFHHSSFLAGRDVKAAGDWWVQNGTLMAISAISGHYRPPLEALCDALHDLKSTSRKLLEKGVVEVFSLRGEPLQIPIEEFLAKSETAGYLAQFKAVK
jgi:hypothetical protein